MSYGNVMAGLLGITMFTVSVQAQGPEELPFRVGWATHIPPQGKRPVLDGKMTREDGWDAAPALIDFTFLVPEGVDRNAYKDEKVAATEARLLYDEEALYIAMRLDGPGRGALKADATERDGEVDGRRLRTCLPCPAGCASNRIRARYCTVVYPPGSQLDWNAARCGRLQG